MQIVNIGKTDWYKAVQDEEGELVYFGTQRQCEIYLAFKG